MLAQLICTGTSVSEKSFLPSYPMTPDPATTTTKQDNGECMQQDAGSAEAPYIKIILESYNGVCTVQAKMKYEDGAAEGDGVTPGSGD